MSCCGERLLVALLLVLLLLLLLVMVEACCNATWPSIRALVAKAQQLGRKGGREEGGGKKT